MSETDSGAEQSTESQTGPGEITQDEIEQLLEHEESTGDDDHTLDETFDLLRNRRRREVLVYLVGTDTGHTTLGDLAEHIAAKENDIERAQLSSTQRKRVYIGLYQCHLPKMDEFGVIEYDQDRGTVELQEDSHLFSYLPELRQESDDTSRVTLYSTAAVVAVVTVGVLGVGPLGAVPTVGWAVLSTGALVAVVLANEVVTSGN